MEYIKLLLIGFVTTQYRVLTSELAHGNCDFSVGLCMWRNADTNKVDWTIGKDVLFMDYFSLLRDHTTGDGSFLYVPSLFINTGDIYRIVSQPISMTNQTVRLTFWYFLTSRETGKISVYTLNKRDTRMYFQQPAGSNSSWNQADITFYEKDEFQIVIEFTKGTDLNGDVAIDDTFLQTVTENTAHSEPAIQHTMSYAALTTVLMPRSDDANNDKCDFEIDTCGWTNNASNTASWELSKIPLPFSDMNGDHTTGDGQFLYLWNSYFMLEGQQAMISNSLIPSNTVKATFWYHLNLPQAGHLAMYPQGKEYMKTVFRLPDDSIHDWHKAEMAFNETEDFNIVIEFTRGIEVFSAVAIDDVMFIYDNPVLETTFSSTEETTMFSTTPEMPTSAETTALPTTTEIPEWKTYVRVNMTRAVSFTEESTGEIECQFEAGSHYLSCSDLTLQWIQNDFILTQSSRLHISSTQEIVNVPLVCSSRLLFSTIYETDEGHVTCQVTGYKDTKDSENTEIYVYERNAILNIFPVTPNVKESQSITFSCTITNIDRLEPGSVRANDIVWCIKDVNVTISNNSYQHTLNYGDEGQMQSQLTVKNPRAGDIFCGVINCSKDHKSTVTIIKKDDVMCKMTNDTGITWNSTKSGSKQKQNCPQGYIGVIERGCTDDGLWSDEDFSNCTKEELEKMNKIIDNMKDKTIDVQIIERALTKVQEVVNTSSSSSSPSSSPSSSSEELDNKIVERSVEIVKKISTANFTFQSKKEAKKTTEALAEVVSTLIEKSTKLATSTKIDDKSKQVSKKKEDTGNKIVESVENFGKSVEKSLEANQSVTVKKGNIEIHIEKTPPAQIDFPKEETRKNGTSRMSKFTLPEESLNSLGFNGSEMVSFTAVRYKSLGSILASEDESSNSSAVKKDKALVNSDILSLKLSTNAKHLSPPIELTFYHNEKNFSSPKCVFLNVTTNRWSKDGCTLASWTMEKSLCKCTHLTNFAVLMSPALAVSTEVSTGMKVISLIGCSFSVACLLLTLLVYINFWRYITSRRSALVISLCIALVMAYLFFMFGVESNGNKVGCIIIAVFLHYLFLVVFATMLSIAIDITLSIVQVFTSTAKYWPLLLLSWGSPVLVVAVSLGITQTKGYGDEQFCWLRGNTLYAFVAPALVIIVVNFIIMIHALKVLYSTHMMMSKTAKEKAKSGVRSVLSLLPLLGLTWLFGVLAINEHLVVFQYLFALFNSTQGILVFVFHVVLNKQIQRAMSQRMTRFRTIYSSYVSTKDDKTKSTAGTELQSTSKVHSEVANDTKITNVDMKDESKKTKEDNNRDMEINAFRPSAIVIANKLYNSKQDQFTSNAQSDTTNGKQTTNADDENQAKNTEENDGKNKEPNAFPSSAVIVENKLYKDITDNATSKVHLGTANDAQTTSGDDETKKTLEGNGEDLVSTGF